MNPGACPIAPSGALTADLIGWIIAMLIYSPVLPSPADRMPEPCDPSRLFSPHGSVIQGLGVSGPFEPADRLANWADSIDRLKSPTGQQMI